MGKPPSGDQLPVNGETGSHLCRVFIVDWSPTEGFVTESIGHKGEPGELKHLSTRRKGHQRDSVSSGERTRTRPVMPIADSGTVWNDGPERVRAPYATSGSASSSRAGHVQSCLNVGGPPSKPKYSSATDSEQVP
jgi:hypothetical protein